jgi:hypothetical protein
MRFASKEDLKTELKKCGKNVKYFIRSYVKISTEEEVSIVPFQLWDFQEEILDNYQQYKQNIILKARQMGVSWLTAAYVAHFILFNRQKHVYFVATREYVAANLLKKVKFILDNLPSWILEGLSVKYVKNNETEIRLENGSFVVAAATGGDVGRSESLSLLVVDEAAFVENMDKLWKGLKPTMACVSGDTFVASQHGLVPIRSLYSGQKEFKYDDKSTELGKYKEVNDLEIWGRNGLEKASHILCSPIKECLKITTKSGIKLKMTPDHPLFVYPKEMDEECKVMAENLDVGDKVQVYRGMNAFPKDDKMLLKTEVWMPKDKERLYSLALRALESR